VADACPYGKPDAGRPALWRDDLRLIQSRHRDPEQSEGVAIQENIERGATLDRRVAPLLAMTLQTDRIALRANSGAG